MSKHDKRHEIMQAAEKLFTSRRFHEITLEDVAASAGVGKGTIYRHFRDKDDLFFQTATSGLDELIALISTKVPGDAPFGEQLSGACVRIASFMERRRQLFRMMQTEDGRLAEKRGAIRAVWTEKREALRAALSGIIRKGVAEGELRDDVPPEVLAGFLLGMLRTRARDFADEPSRYVGTIALLLSIFRHGAQPDPEKSKPAGRRSVSTDA
jgi:TetR/AcrR family fatty acid metabolism transcriptional regulator